MIIKTEKGSLEVDDAFKLTEEEKVEVQRLKLKCDEEEVAYRSVFELVKYSFVSSSISDPKKRLMDSFSRLKLKREFESKHDLDSLDLFECVDRLEAAMPDWSKPCGTLNGRNVLAYTSAGSNRAFFREKKALETICKVEFARYDLAAATLDEARNGFYLMGVTHGLKESPLKFVGPVMSMRVLFAKMHSNRVKGLFWQVNGFVCNLVNVLIKILPKGLKDRLLIETDFEPMRKKLNISKEEWSQNIPSLVCPEGKYDKSLKEWITERKKIYAETERLVTL